MSKRKSKGDASFTEEEVHRMRLEIEGLRRACDKARIAVESLEVCVAEMEEAASPWALWKRDLGLDVLIGVQELRRRIEGPLRRMRAILGDTPFGTRRGGW